MLKNFIKRTVIFASIIATIAFFLFQFVIPQFYIPIFPFLFAFFVILTIIVHAFLTKAGKQKVLRFSTYFLGSITAKLLLYMIFITVYVIVDKKSAAPFLISFLILYFLFTIFETLSLLNDLKKQSSSENQVSTNTL